MALQPPDSEIVQRLDGYEITIPYTTALIRQLRVAFSLAVVFLSIGGVLLVIGALGSESLMRQTKSATGALMSLLGTVILKLYKGLRIELAEIRGDQTTYQKTMAVILSMAPGDARELELQNLARNLQKKSWWKHLFG